MAFGIKISNREAKELEKSPAFCALVNNGYLECKRKFLSDIILLHEDNLSLIKDILSKDPYNNVVKDLISAVDVIIKAKSGGVK